MSGILTPASPNSFRFRFKHDEEHIVPAQVARLKIDYVNGDITVFIQQPRHDLRLQLFLMETAKLPAVVIIDTMEGSEIPASSMKFTVDMVEHEYLLDYSLDTQPAVHRIVLKIKDE